MVEGMEIYGTNVLTVSRPYTKFRNESNTHRAKKENGPVTAATPNPHSTKRTMP